eukprot:2395128-Prymnesium_polylepis.1
MEIQIEISRFVISEGVPIEHSGLEGFGVRPASGRRQTGVRPASGRRQAKTAIPGGNRHLVGVGEGIE